MNHAIPDALLQAVDKPLAPGEVELTQIVQQLLGSEGFTQDQLAVFVNDNNIRFAVGRNNNVQRQKLNQFLNSQYLSVSVDTSRERGFLLESGSLENWIQTFRLIHMPAMKAMGLPRAYSL